MDINDKEIQAMKEIVDVAVGIPLFTYEMQQNAPRPQGEYAAVKCYSSSNPGYDETRIVDINGADMFRTRGIRILTFYILFSRDGQEYIDFDNSFYRPDVQAKMREHGFAALGKEALNLATVQLETNWEPRNGVKMQFNVLREQVSPIGSMANAVVGGKFIDGDQVIEIKG
ncbi:putative tail completion protein [Erwinia phage Fougasse]|nr:putative tail completion protein [Erwinia phage Berlingot]WJN63809.1 putative tail completion protein [Erwinia phage Calisson]WJN63922.1 putative tail completion protein [Erwinia phage Farigoule]WJN63981.1 putative tail completion protein [Erwinia phage Fougasse]WJN64078.1 putative tail completion protein [Erwinia phage Mauresque]WJN64156.1 putative tail completion protein [Erwinia phage Navette]WJN64214.1 putative tail completion protein [Erwinia phage Nougat]WJN64518.1 putative tail com